MNEGYEIADVYLPSYMMHLTEKGLTTSIDVARKYMKDIYTAQGLRWDDYLTHQMIDNIAEGLSIKARKLG